MAWRWPILLVAATAVGFGLPGLADHLSINRDRQLQSSIDRLNVLVEGLLQPPTSWRLQVGGTSYMCTRDGVSASAQVPAYTCRPAGR